jgi:hypothetical protein
MKTPESIKSWLNDLHEEQEAGTAITWQMALGIDASIKTLELALTLPSIFEVNLALNEARVVLSESILDPVMTVAASAAIETYKWVLLP